MTLVDTNILLDFITEDPTWFRSSRAAFIERASAGPMLIIDPIFAETSVAFPDAAACSRFVDTLGLEHVQLSRQALWRAGQAFRRYRGHGGSRTSVLADFFIGAHAEALGCAVLTRDTRRYRTYFPDVELITPGP